MADCKWNIICGQDWDFMKFISKFKLLHRADKLSLTLGFSLRCAPQTPILPPPYMFGAVSLYIVSVTCGCWSKKKISKFKDDQQRITVFWWWLVYTRQKRWTVGRRLYTARTFSQFWALRISFSSCESTDDIIDRWWTISYTLNIKDIFISKSLWHPFQHLN